MPTQTALQLGESFSRLVYIDKDDVRHIARIAGYGEASHGGIHYNFHEAHCHGHRAIVAPATLLNALLESALSRAVDKPLCSCRKTSHFIDSGVAHAGDTVKLTIKYTAFVNGWRCFNVEVVNESGAPILSGTVKLEI